MVRGRGAADQAGSFPWGSEKIQVPRSLSAVDLSDSLSHLGRRKKIRRELTLPTHLSGMRNPHPV